MLTKATDRFLKMIAIDRLDFVSCRPELIDHRGLDVTTKERSGANLLDVGTIFEVTATVAVCDGDSCLGFLGANHPRRKKGRSIGCG